MKRLYKTSRWTHKYIGLLLILFSMWMSVSGILLNHPGAISELSVPRWLIPGQYRVEDWERSSLINVEYSSRDFMTAFIGGKLGVWKTDDGGMTFQPMDSGFPLSPYLKKTNHIYLQEGNRSLLLAGTDAGLYSCDLPDETWKKVPLGKNRERVLKIVPTETSLLVFTPSHVYSSSLSENEPDFKKITVSRDDDKIDVSLVRLFFDLHHGAVWRLSGRLLYDVAGLIILFLSLSAFYIWYNPRKRKRARGRSITIDGRRGYQFLFAWHLKTGIWAALLLMIITGTGFFMRPPMLALLVNGSVTPALYPGPFPSNPWDEKIHNALYDSTSDQIIIEATDGFWTGPADFSSPFIRKELPVTVFVMGTTVFETYGENEMLVGSYSGLFRFDYDEGTVIDMLTGKKAGKESSVRPAETMVTGYFITPQGEEFISSHKGGIQPLGGVDREGRFSMPVEAVQGFRMSLWNYMFELHNGRLFQDILGGFYILLVPLGSFLFGLIVITGVFDWFYLRGRRDKRA